MNLNYNSLLIIKSYVKYPVTRVLDHLNIKNPYVQVAIVLYIVFVLSSILCYLVLKLKNLLGSSDVSMQLHRAVLEDSKIKCIRIMERYPHAVNMQLPPENYTPFLRACLLGNTQLIKLMIKYGANLNLVTAKKETCFYLAVYSLVNKPDNRDASCIHTLYYAGVDINARNEKGFNALHLAAMFGHTTLVRWLLTKGADRNVLPPPYVLARMQGHYYTASLLKPTTLPCLQ